MQAAGATLAVAVAVATLLVCCSAHPHEALNGNLVREKRDHQLSRYVPYLLAKRLYNARSVIRRQGGIDEIDATHIAIGGLRRHQWQQGGRKTARQSPSSIVK